MDTLKRDIGNFLKILGAVLVTWLGGAIVAGSGGGSSLSGSDNWQVIPKVCGTALVVAGAAACIFFLWSKTLRIRVDSADKSLEAGPAGEGEKKA